MGQRNNQRINTGEWDDELLHNVGTVREYTERSPKAYLNANTDFVHNDQTWDQVAKVDADEVKREAKILARLSEHNRDSVAHRTRPHGPVQIDHSLMQRPRLSLFQRQSDDTQRYDHTHE